MTMPGFRVCLALGAMTMASGCGLLGGRGGGESPAQALAREQADARIRTELEARLAAEPSLGSGRVRVVVERREVQLHGSVAGMAALRCAETNAQLTAGVELVIDHLVLEPGPSAAPCRAPRRP